MRTVNNLPDNFTGKLNIVLNDICPPVCFRNLTLLLILSTINDPALAADVALHFWFSVLLPEEHLSHVRDAVNKFLNVTDSSQKPFQLTPTSTISVTPDICGPLGNSMAEVLKSYRQPAKFTSQDAMQELHRRREDPQWNDFRETRLYFRLRPSHRVAARKARHKGLVLPFGASSEPFKTPNSSLFTPAGEWLPTAEVDPLHGWNRTRSSTLESRYGATSEDIYGCLYFFLTEQLRKFARRLVSFRMSLNIIVCDAKQVPKLLSTGELSAVGLPQETRFDRIAASNIMDSNYLGLKGVLTSLGPLLARSRHSTLVGYSLNWNQDQRDGHLNGASQSKARQAMTHLQTSPGFVSASQLLFKGSKAVVAEAFSMDAELGHENSGAFSQYLNNQGLTQALAESKLKMKTKHTILPRRIGIPVDSPHTALPKFSIDESWYLHTRSSGCDWLERFMEFTPADI
ncbi:hypothetical protein BKA70DRAFT_1428792 [Coprinopsis sp. MPI-PUGE-AT-0042]|nr:hypothetical protein BKA70DRAFT_1428792 [Coprinopsis sp. MPI-PUGE-AT-0042]